MRTYEPLPGESIGKTAKQMVALAQKTKGTVTADFNGIALTAKPGDNPDAIVKRFETEANRQHEEYINSAEYKKEQCEAEEAQRRHDLMLKRALAAAPEKMTVRDEKEWKEIVAANIDGYGQGVISFAERWARLMERRMANGDALEACAEEAASLANNDGITGFMYGEAVRILSKAWIHGEKLRCWHNLKTQLGTEGEKANKSGKVLNPALLTIG